MALQRPEQRVDARVRELALILRARAAEHRHAIGVGACRIEQRGLAAARLAAQEKRTTVTGAGAGDHPRNPRERLLAARP